MISVILNVSKNVSTEIHLNMIEIYSASDVPCIDGYHETGIEIECEKVDK